MDFIYKLQYEIIKFFSNIEMERLENRNLRSSMNFEITLKVMDLKKKHDNEE